MATIESKHSLSSDVQMRTPNGDTINAHLKAVNAFAEEDSIQEVMITFDISSNEYNNIVNPNEYFNSSVSRRQGNPKLTEDTPIEIKARLNPDNASAAAEQGVHAMNVADVLRSASADSVLMATETWYALQVQQEVPVPPEVGSGTLKEGYRLTL